MILVSATLKAVAVREHFDLIPSGAPARLPVQL